MLTSDDAQPVRARPVAHYVLFGPPGHPSTQVNLWLAQDYLLAFTPTFGFDPHEAARAERVTIIGGVEVVSDEVAEDLAERGAQVQRIQGTVAEVAQTLTQLIEGGRPF